MIESKKYLKFQYKNNKEWKDKVFDDIGIFSDGSMCFVEPMIFHEILEGEIVVQNSNSYNISPLNCSNYIGQTEKNNYCREISKDEINNLVKNDIKIAIIDNKLYIKKSILKNGFSSMEI